MSRSARTSAIELPHLETFSKVAEQSSFTTAAKELGVTQATVSQRIQALEAILKTPLFERTGGKVVISAAGKRLYSDAQKILDLHRKAYQEITGSTVTAGGRLTIVTNAVPGECLVASVLKKFHSQDPGIRVRVDVVRSLTALKWVESGKARLGLVGRKSESPNLEFHPFADDQLLLVVSTGHRWYGKKRVSFEEVSKEPLIVRERSSGSRWCLEQALSHSGKSLSQLNVVLEFGSNEGIKKAVYEGLGVAVLSRLAARDELESGKLHGLHITGLRLDRKLFVVWDKRKLLPASARSFVRVLESEADAVAGHK